MPALKWVSVFKSAARVLKYTRWCQREGQISAPLHRSCWLRFLVLACYLWRKLAKHEWFRSDESFIAELFLFGWWFPNNLIFQWLMWSFLPPHTYAVSHCLEYRVAVLLFLLHSFLAFNNNFVCAEKQMFHLIASFYTHIFFRACFNIKICCLFFANHSWYPDNFADHISGFEPLWRCLDGSFSLLSFYAVPPL